MGRRWPVMPGVPAAGHLTGGGFWHPGRPEGCVKCGDDCAYPNCHSSASVTVRRRRLCRAHAREFRQAMGDSP